MDTDTRVASAVVALYFVLVVVLLPSDEYLRGLGGGILVFAVVVGVAQRLGRGPLPGMSILVVAFTSAIVLEIPTFPAMGGTHPIAVPLGFLGMQAAVLLWAARRRSPQPPLAEHMSLVKAWKFGAFAALGLSMIATIPVLITIGAGGRANAPLLLVYPAYFGGLLAAATVYWLLQPISHLAVGQYLVGFVGGTCVYGAIAPVVALVDHEPFEMGMMLVIAGFAGGLVGPAVALDTKDERAPGQRGPHSGAGKLLPK